MSLPAPEEAPSHLAPDAAQRVAVADTSAPYALTTILSSARTASAADFASAPSRIAASPCIRPALFWSFVIGGLLSLHRRRLGGSLQRCALDAYAGGGATLCWSWYSCRLAERDKALTMSAYYASLQDRGGGSMGAAARGAEPPQPAPPAGEGEQWQRELERLAPRSG